MGIGGLGVVWFLLKMQARELMKSLRIGFIIHNLLMHQSSVEEKKWCPIDIHNKPILWWKNVGNTMVKYDKGHDPSRSVMAILWLWEILFHPDVLFWSHMTGLATEPFAKMMKERKRGTLILKWDTPNREWCFNAFVPKNVVLSAVSGKWWSVSGVEPLIAAQASDALNVDQKKIGLRHQRKIQGYWPHSLADLFLQ